MKQLELRARNGIWFQFTHFFSNMSSIEINWDWYHFAIGLSIIKTKGMFLGNLCFLFLTFSVNLFNNKDMGV